MGLHNAYNWNKDGGKCPSCNSTDKKKDGILQLRKGRFGAFLGCSRYPNCKFSTTAR